tara:strand:+ start:801 stop:1031 length:231 start_codon:yes stop_codon:yes gene_type:complete
MPIARYQLAFMICAAVVAAVILVSTSLDRLWEGLYWAGAVCFWSFMIFVAMYGAWRALGRLQAHFAAGVAESAERR